MLEFNWRKTNWSVVPPFIWHTFGHPLYHVYTELCSHATLHMRMTMADAAARNKETQSLADDVGWSKYNFCNFHSIKYT